MIFPVHQEDISHWCLVVADVSAKQITCFDSIEKENSHCVMNLKQYLFKLNGEWYSITDLGQKSIPRQSNSYDCGVFTCLFARFLAANCRFDLLRNILLLLDSKCNLSSCRKFVAALIHFLSFQ